jgi:cytochrome d ubiquinol oxidase subunit I
VTDGETALILARVQFAFTVAFHFIFPAFSIGLASYLAVLEGLWLRTGQASLYHALRYWMKIFAITFAMGVVSGIVMSYQFGTNWSVFRTAPGRSSGRSWPMKCSPPSSSKRASSRHAVRHGAGGRKLHFVATCMVAAGTLMSAFWILSANSWMHTPTGYAVNAAGQFVPRELASTSFSSELPLPSHPHVIAAYLTTALVVGGVGAWHLLRGARTAEVPTDVLDGDVDGSSRRAAQIFVGDMHGLATLSTSRRRSWQSKAISKAIPKARRGSRSAFRTRQRRPSAIDRIRENGFARPPSRHERAHGRPRHGAARRGRRR